jgi:hypothetical protein
MASRTRPAATAAGILPLALSFLGHVSNPAATTESVASTQPSALEAIYPDPDRTPGVPNAKITQDSILADLCSKSTSTKLVRPPESYTNELKLKQLKEYGDTISDPNATCMLGSDNPKCYEEDHLIALEDGGDPSNPENLWPEPYDTKIKGQTVGAHQKDTVEDFIHDEVCYEMGDKRTSRMPAHISITLARGQEILAKDWYACYQSIQDGKDCK